MRKNKIKLFVLLSVLIYSGTLPGQAKLSTNGCTQLLASLHISEYDDDSEYTCLLEKEIISGVWKKVDRRQSSSAFIVFTDLDKGTYRVTFFLSSGSKWQEKTALLKADDRHAHSEQEEWESTGYISNVVHHLPAEDCEKSPAHVNERQVPQTVTVFPNPAVNEIQIHCEVQEPQTIRVQIVNTQGKVIKELLLSSQTQNISLEDIHDGVYVVQIIDLKTSLEIHSEKLIITK